jgi:hypothetical protein
MNPLRINKPGKQKPWTEDEVVAGLLAFKAEFGRYPTATEIDAYTYLPSSRSIQRAFGGLVALRKRLIPDDISDHTTGAYRQAKAREADARANKYEGEFYEFLTAHMQEIAVHEHKIIRPGSIASDFFIYLTQSTGIVIDLFYAQDMHSLVGIVNYKVKRYASVPYDTYFISVGNEKLTHELVSAKMRNRLTALPDHIHVVTEQMFKGHIIQEVSARSNFAISKNKP